MVSYEKNVAVLKNETGSRSRAASDALWEATYDVRRHLVQNGTITSVTDMIEFHCPLLSKREYVS